MNEPTYPESTLLRSGVGMRIVRPMVVILMAPLLIPIGIYGLYDHSYGLAAFFGLPPLLGILIFTPALRRAGSFELTSHRLWHKPWFRARRAYPLAGMSDLACDADSARVRSKAVGLDLAFAGSYDRLRGLLAIRVPLARLPFPAPTAEAFAPWILWPAVTTAKRPRRGFMIVLGELCAFVPETFPPPSAGATAASLAVNLLTLPLGVAMVPVHVIPPVADVLAFFYSAPQSIRQFAVDALSKLMGGWAVGVAAARCTPLTRPDGVMSLTLETPNADPVTGHVTAEMGRDLMRRLPNVVAAEPTYR